MANEVLNNVAEAAVEAVAENTEVIKTVGTKTVVLFGAACAGAGVLVDELTRFIVRKCKASKDGDLEKTAKKQWKLFKRKARDVKNDISDAVEDTVEDVKDFIETEEE